MPNGMVAELREPAIGEEWIGVVSVDGASDNLESAEKGDGDSELSLDRAELEFLGGVLKNVASCCSALCSSVIPMCINKKSAHPCDTSWPRCPSNTTPVSPG